VSSSVGVAPRAKEPRRPSDHEPIEPECLIVP
jgi:hypothetical protein